MQVHRFPADGPLIFGAWHLCYAPLENTSTQQEILISDRLSLYYAFLALYRDNSASFLFFIIAELIYVVYLILLFEEYITSNIL